MKRKDFFKALGITLGGSVLFKKSSAAYNPSINSPTSVIAKPTDSKKILIFGDSISETVIRTYNWPSQISNLVFSSIYNYSVQGAKYKNFTGAVTNQQVSDQIAAAIADNRNPDYIVFALGTNDQEVSLGSYATAMGKATLADLDKTLLYEALRYAYWSCGTQWPNVIQYAVLPLQRIDVDITAMTNLRTAIISMANRYNVRVIDGTYESCIVSDYETNPNARRFLSDGLHPNAAGSLLVAKLISSKILSSTIT